jgi:hypothetical protein
MTSLPALIICEIDEHALRVCEIVGSCVHTVDAYQRCLRRLSRHDVQGSLPRRHEGAGSHVDIATPRLKSRPKPPRRTVLSSIDTKTNTRCNTVLRPRWPRLNWIPSDRTEPLPRAPSAAANSYSYSLYGDASPEAVARLTWFSALPASLPAAYMIMANPREVPIRPKLSALNEKEPP